MNVPFAYNLIVGIPLLHWLTTPPSTYNLKMQFLADNCSIGRIVGDQKSAKQCHISTLKASIHKQRIR